jgi:hypothetical protein
VLLWARSDDPASALIEPHKNAESRLKMEQSIKFSDVLCTAAELQRGAGTGDAACSDRDEA